MNDTPGEKLEWIRSVMAQYQSRLIFFAARITGDLDSARDVVQDTFLSLCHQDPGLIRDRLAPWLYTVCRNRARESSYAGLAPRHDPSLGTDLGGVRAEFLSLAGRARHLKRAQ
jgi:hypothetical protein